MFQSALLTDSWQLDLQDDTRPSRLDPTTIAQLVATIEQHGIDSFPHGQDDDLPEIDQLTRAGIASGYRRAELHGLIYLASPGFLMWTGADHLTEAVARNIDLNRAKLAGGPGERHLFIWIEFHSTPTWVQVTGGPLPEHKPPTEDVDVVWIAAKEQARQPHLWRGDSTGWQKVAGP